MVGVCERQCDSIHPCNIAEFLSFPDYTDIKWTGLEEEVDWDDVAKVLTGDDEVIWPQ